MFTGIIEEIGHAKVIGITGHIRPDGDCVGSTLGLYNYIRKNLPECEVTVYLEKPSDEFNYLSGINVLTMRLRISILIYS